MLGKAESKKNVDCAICHKITYCGTEHRKLDYPVGDERQSHEMCERRAHRAECRCTRACVRGL